MTTMTDRLLTEEEATDFLNIAKQTLRVWRMTGRYGLPFVKLGRSVRYKLSDLEKFRDERTVTNTAEGDQL